MRLRVGGLGGELCALEVHQDWTVPELKQAIEKATGIPRREQRLFFGASELRELPGEEPAPLSVTLQGGGDDEPRDIALVRRSKEHVTWLERAQRDGYEALRKGPEWIRADQEITRAAIEEAGASAMELVAKELRMDRNFVQAAVKLSGEALQFAAQELRGDRAVVRAAVERDPCALEFAASKLQADRALVLFAVRLDGSALEFASDNLKRDKDAVLTAVCENGRAIRFASTTLRADLDVATAAVSQNPIAIELLPTRLQEDERVIEAAFGEQQAVLSSWSNQFLRLVEVEVAQESLCAQAEEAPPWCVEPEVVEEEVEPEVGEDERIEIATHWRLEGGELAHRWLPVRLPLPLCCAACAVGRHLWCWRCGPTTMPEAHRIAVEAAAQDFDFAQKESAGVRKWLSSGLFWTGAALQACALKEVPFPQAKAT